MLIEYVKRLLGKRKIPIIDSDNTRDESAKYYSVSTLHNSPETPDREVIVNHSYLEEMRDFYRTHKITSFGISIDGQVNSVLLTEEQKDDLERRLSNHSVGVEFREVSPTNRINHPAESEPIYV